MIGEAAEEYYGKVGFSDNASIDGTEVAPRVGTQKSLGQSRATPIIVPFPYEPKAREHTF